MTSTSCWRALSVLFRAKHFFLLWHEGACCTRPFSLPQSVGCLSSGSHAWFAVHIRQPLGRSRACLLCNNCSAILFAGETGNAVQRQIQATVRDHFDRGDRQLEDFGQWCTCSNAGNGRGGCVKVLHYVDWYLPSLSYFVLGFAISQHSQTPPLFSSWSCLGRGSLPGADCSMAYQHLVSFS